MLLVLIKSASSGKKLNNIFLIIIQTTNTSCSPAQAGESWLFTNSIRSKYCLNPCPAEPGYILPLQTVEIQISWLLKKPTDLDLHCLPLSMWYYSKNPDQVIWLAENYKWAWYLNLFSRTRVKKTEHSSSISQIHFCFLHSGKHFPHGDLHYLLINGAGENSPVLYENNDKKISLCVFTG